MDSSSVFSSDAPSEPFYPPYPDESLQHPEVGEVDAARDSERKGRIRNRPEDRVMRPSCGPFCRFKCDTKITEDYRREIFTYFWNLEDHGGRWDFLIRNTVDRCVQSNTSESSNRSLTRNYFFHVNGVRITVCKTMFLNTLAISDSWIKTASTKFKKGEQMVDNRGRVERKMKARTVDSQVFDGMVEYVKSMLALNQKNVNAKRTYEMYKEWAQGRGCTAGSERCYRIIFNRIKQVKKEKDTAT